MQHMQPIDYTFQIDPFGGGKSFLLAVKFATLRQTFFCLCGNMCKVKQSICPADSQKAVGKYPALEMKSFW